MKRRYVGVLLLIFSVGTGFASDDQPPIPLSEGSSRILIVPPFPASGAAQCDSSGNLYFHSGKDPNQSTVLKLAESDGGQTAYRVPDETKGMYFLAFNVVDDKVWILMGGPKDVILVYVFSVADPVNASRTELNSPKGLDALSVGNFVVLPGDKILLQGFFGEKAPTALRGKGYRAVFDNSGKVLKMTAVRDRDGKLREASNQAANSSAVRGKDGSTYFLEPQQVVVLAPSGQVLRRMKLSISAGFVPFQLYMNEKRQLMVSFTHTEKINTPLELELALLNINDGETIRLYKPSPELGNNMVCLSDEGAIFLILEREKKQLKLVTAPLK